MPMASERHAKHTCNLVCITSPDDRGGLGVHNLTHIVNAMHYGVPQCSRRLLLIGVRNWSNSPPSQSTPYSITVRQALESLGPPSGVCGHTLHTAAARVYNGRAPSDMGRPAHAVVSRARTRSVSRVVAFGVSRHVRWHVCSHHLSPLSCQ